MRAVILASVLVPSLERGGDDVHRDKLLPAFVRVFSEVLIVCHTAAEGTCELVDDDIDHCSIWHFGVGVQSIYLIHVIWIKAGLPEFVDFQVCPISAVMVSIV